MHFADRLILKVKEGKSPICVGLDPHFANLPQFLLKRKKEEYGDNSTAVAESIIEFNKGIVDAVKEVALAVKPQFAFYEIWGSEGIRALEETCRYIKKKTDLIIIGDGKRNDIGSTAQAYAEAYLTKKVGNIYPNSYQTDALTVTPFLGEDGILPFVDACCENETGMFVLVKTSNPSGGEFQDLIVGEEMLYEKIAFAVSNWGLRSMGESGFSAVGAVVGATYPEELKILRQTMPAQIFLIPGYGVQGGRLEDLKPAFYQGQKGALINSSRGVIFAYQKEERFSEENYAEASYEEVKKMQREINQILD